MFHAREGWVPIAVDLLHGSRAAGDQPGDVTRPSAEHGVHGYPETGVPDRRQVDEVAYPFQVRWVWIKLNDKALVTSAGQWDLLNWAGFSYRQLELVRKLLCGATGILGLELEPVPVSGIVGRGDDGGPGGLMMQNVETNYGGWGCFL